MMTVVSIESIWILTISIFPVPVQAHIGISGKIEAVTAQILADPQTVELYLLRGDLHRINGHWSEAISDFNKVRQLDPDNAAAELGMGRT